MGSSQILTPEEIKALPIGTKIIDQRNAVYTISGKGKLMFLITDNQLHEFEIEMPLIYYRLGSK